MTNKNKNYLDGKILTFREIMTGNIDMKNLKFKKNYNMDIYNLMNQRISMQSTRNNLSKEMNLYIDSSQRITTPEFVYNYFTWDFDKQNKFLDIVIGKIYKKEARRYFNDLKTEYDRVLWQTAEAETKI